MLGNVLIVENNTSIASEICEQLEKINCCANNVPTKETLNKAGQNSVEYERLVMEDVKSALKKEPYDVVVVNLHLDDDSRILGGGNFLGGAVLDFVSENYIGIIPIVYTANSQYISRSLEMANRYNLAEIVNKGMPIKIKDVVDIVEKVLINGHPLKRIVEPEYILDGVNSQMIRYLFNHGTIQEIFANIKDYEKKIFISLQSNNHPEKIRESADLMTELWHEEPGLPCYPLIDHLGQLEHVRAFWSEHRDHIIHQQLVYLLGLYLFMGCPKLHNILTEKITEKEFFKVWKITALFHDLGNVFETEKKEYSVGIFQRLNDLLSYPLYFYLNSHGMSILKTEEEEIIRKYDIRTEFIGFGKTTDLSKFGDMNLFNCLEPGTEAINLGKNNNNIERYWNYTMSNDAKNRKSYVDHGIAGALILLKQYFSLKHSLDLATKKNKKISSSDGLSDSLQYIATQVRSYETSVQMAASAISLHNVNVDNWIHDDAYSKEKLTLHKYKLSLSNAPLAFFLALVDALQAWDRPKFTMPSKEDHTVYSHDISIRFEAGKIQLINRIQPDFYVDLFESLSHYIDRNDLDSIFEYKS